MNQTYTEEEKSYIKINADVKDKDLHVLFNEKFGRNIKFATFRKLRQRLGITKLQGRPSGKTDR